MVNYASNKAAADDVVAGIESGGGKALAWCRKLDGATAVRELFAATIAAFGRIDILVINAASARFGPITGVSEEEFDRTFATNVKSAFFAFQEAAKQMSEGGRIVSISAALTGVGYDNTALYAGTKGALEVRTEHPRNRSRALVAQGFSHPKTGIGRSQMTIGP
jgi:3-oxoacyl-[acyl-carrier protein] reductase